MDIINRALPIVRKILDTHADEANQAGTFDTFSGFPTSACRDTSMLLFVIFEANGLGDLELVSGVTDDGRTHAWLEYDGYIIDITADQFGDTLGRQMATIYLDNSRIWHNKNFKNQKRESGPQLRWQIDNYRNSHFNKIFNELLKNVTEKLKLAI